jgi:hypothetical protein
MGLLGAFSYLGGTTESRSGICIAADGLFPAGRSPVLQVTLCEIFMLAHTKHSAGILSSQVAMGRGHRHVPYKVRPDYSDDRHDCHTDIRNRTRGSPPAAERRFRQFS